MGRTLKNFSDIRPSQTKLAAPQANSFTLDLAGLGLSEEQISEVRQEAVKAAMLAASRLSKVLDITDSFSTFSTFSTFSSGSANLPTDGLKIPGIVDRVLKGN
jgi:hypothetical protein